MEFVLEHLHWLYFVIPIVVIVVMFRFVARLFGVVIIPENNIGLINKKFVVAGSNKTLPEGTIIALKGEAGWQADTLAQGIYYFMWPWQYEIKIVPCYVVPAGNIGTVSSKDGKPIATGRVLGKKVDCDTFQNARVFLEQGGQRGPQTSIIPPGMYRINTVLFDIQHEPILEIESGKVGIVTVKDGVPLPTGEIAGREVEGHNSFQDAQAFIDAGGFKGRQEQVIMAGKYFVNPSFATVEQVAMTEVEIAHVGVLISYVGADGKDVSGTDFQHGNLVEKGNKGVCSVPLDPGRYAINPYTHLVVSVPTQNVVLNWANNKNESHKLDEKLSSITVRTKDGFPFNLDVAQIINIPRNWAPFVIAQFGSVENLVTQVLAPIIGNYFRNAAQGSDVIQFLTERQMRQAEAKTEIDKALTVYHVGAIDTLIGDINPPEELMQTLKNRQIATQQKATFVIQTEAQGERQKLEQSTAMADTQKDVVTAERQVSIQQYSANAAIETAKGQAGAKTANAEADATVLKLVGDATAARTLAIGKAEAEVIELKIKSMTSDNYTQVLIAEHLSKATQSIVPQIIVGGGEGGKGGTLVDVLVANMIHDRIKTDEAKELKPETAPAAALEAPAPALAAPAGEAKVGAAEEP